MKKEILIKALNAYLAYLCVFEQHNICEQDYAKKCIDHLDNGEKISKNWFDDNVSVIAKSIVYYRKELIKEIKHFNMISNYEDAEVLQKEREELEPMFDYIRKFHAEIYEDIEFIV